MSTLVPSLKLGLRVWDLGGVLHYLGSTMCSLFAHLRWFRLRVVCKESCRFSSIHGMHRQPKQLGVFPSTAVVNIIMVQCVTTNSYVYSYCYCYDAVSLAFVFLFLLFVIVAVVVIITVLITKANSSPYQVAPRQALRSWGPVRQRLAKFILLRVQDLWFIGSRV